MEQTFIEFLVRNINASSFEKYLLYIHTRVVTRSLATQMKFYLQRRSRDFFIRAKSELSMIHTNST
jgi:hypothetical protein